jgi:Leucine-rich repeat (LRR) protein
VASEGDSSSSSSSDDDDDELVQAATQFSPLTASPPSDLTSYAHLYQLEDARSTDSGPALLELVDSSDREDEASTDRSTATEPRSNTTPLKGLSEAPSLDEAWSTDGEEEDIEHQGPGTLYLDTGRRWGAPRPPTPPRVGEGLAAMVPASLLPIDKDDSQCEDSQSSGCLEDGRMLMTEPIQLSRQGQVVFHTDLASDEGSDLPPTDGPYRKKKRRVKRRVGIYFIGLAVGLLMALLVVVMVRTTSTDRRRDAAEIVPDRRFTLPPTVSPVAAATLAPTVYKSPLPTAVPSGAPSLDPIQRARREQGQQLLTAVDDSLVAAWELPSSPPAQALAWWISDAAWDSYTDERKLQRYALAVLYFGTQGDDHWTTATGWLSDEDECTWFTSSASQVCNPQGRLQVLHLDENGLAGTLPPEVGLLTDLVGIRLVGNALLGTIPVLWARLVNLQVLELRENLLVGPLPIELAAWTQLETLDLAVNRLEGNLPEVVADWPLLTFLLLGGNGFVGELPESWSLLSRLRVLSVEGNQLTGGVPVAYGGGMPQLRELLLSDNNLQDWSPEAWNFGFLERLDMSLNSFQQPLPAELFSLISLISLNLAGNAINGTLDERLADLDALEDIDLSGNQFEGVIPNALGDIRNILSLQLQDNRFTGELPNAFGRFRRIEQLRVDGNLLEMVENVCRWLEDTLLTFYADCSGSDSLDCACCTHCCTDEDACVEVTSTEGN